MAWFWIMFIFYGLFFGLPKIAASAKGERVCVYCRKRLKFSGATGHYAEVCSHCGRTQPDR